MKYINYEKRYDEDIKKLIIELQEYIVSLDDDELNIISLNYDAVALETTLKEISKNNGKMILAIDDNMCIGFVVGTIVKYEEIDYYDYKCPLKGEITELIVNKHYHSRGIGNQLVKFMEDYFISKKCEYITLDVFAYNTSAIKFYKNNGYHNRLISMMKKIK